MSGPSGRAWPLAPRAVLLLLAFCLARPGLWAGSCKANSLGQNIDALPGPSVYRMEDSPPAEAVMPSVYGLGRQGFSASSRTLLKDGEPWKRFDSFTKGPVVVDAVWDSGREDLESVSCFENGFLTYRGDEDSSTRFVYDEAGHLLQALHRRGGRLESADFHYRSADGGLAMVRTVRMSESEDVLISDSFILEEGQLVTPKAALDLKRKASGARMEGGMLVFSSVSPGGVATETTMDENGQIVRIERKSGGNVLSLEERSYSDAGVLKYSRKIENNAEVASEYKDGALAKETRWEDGEMVLVNLFEDGTKRQTLYEFGEPYAVVVYDNLTGRIQKVEYL